MTENNKFMLEGQVIDERAEVTVVQLCRSCAIEFELVERLMAEGVIEPSRREGETLYFPQHSVKRARIVVRLRSDLGLNLAGAALAVELLERIERLESRLRFAELLGGQVPR